LQTQTQTHSEYTQTQTHSEYTHPVATMVKKLKYLWHAYNLALQKYALAQVITAGSLYAAGDALCQFVMIRREKSKKQSAESMEADSSESHGQTKYDIWRTVRFGVYGLCISGPLSYLWYRALDRFIHVPKGLATWSWKSVKMSLQKVLWDELVFGPVTLGVFFTCISLLEGKTLHESVQKCKKEFWTTLIVDFILWPPAQFINFMFLPTHFRILYISTLNLFWNAFLSNMQHNGLDLHAIFHRRNMNKDIEQEIHKVD